jgi:AcrR family transcriptional regulator
MVDLLSTPVSVESGAMGSGSGAGAKKTGPRDRLVASTQRLTAARGVGVGVDAILEDAEVARRSLYQHFGGKDGLIAAALEDSARTDEAKCRAALESGGTDASRRVLAVFDALDRTISTAGFNGCRYVAAEHALTDRNHPAHEVTRAYTGRLHALFVNELASIGHPDPATGAEQLLVLVDGALVIGVIRPDSHPALAVRPLVEHILAEGRGS